MNLTQRQRELLYMALAYAHANTEDLCDGFAPSGDEDADNEDGKAEIHLNGDGTKAVIVDAPDESEFQALMRDLLGVRID